jgi:hypothetical protein
MLYTGHAAEVPQRATNALLVSEPTLGNNIATSTSPRPNLKLCRNPPNSFEDAATCAEAFCDTKPTM